MYYVTSGVLALLSQWVQLHMHELASDLPVDNAFILSTMDSHVLSGFNVFTL